MAFVNAMNTTKSGVNGATVYTEEGVGDYRVSLFTMLNRNLGEKYIQTNVANIYMRGVPDEIQDLFVMAFQTRDVRGGKGERALFYAFMKVLYAHDPYTVKHLLQLVPEYGCWKDLWELAEKVPELEPAVLALAKQQFEQDLNLLQQGKHAELSLLAKWLPREGSKTHPRLAKKLASFFYAPAAPLTCTIRYRKNVAALNRVLRTVEINMCGNTWASIRPEAVPGRCLSIHTKAFLNRTKGDDVRYPNRPDREACRQNFLKFIDGMKRGTSKAHGAHVVMPHELVTRALEWSATQEDQDLYQGQWDSIREETLKLGGLGKCVPMCDFSGSMDGVPKLVSLALGILVSEINHSTFKDHILTFDSTPKWHSFAGKTTLKSKLDSVRGDLGQGLSTNFYDACMLILSKMKRHKVPPGEEPEDLLVLTDMGFDAATHNTIPNKFTRANRFESRDPQELMLESIREAFVDAGEKLWGKGKGWKAPRIVVWNLRAEYKDFHATAHQDGVVQLSGWSPAMLKALQKSGVCVKTPYEGMRAILDDARYDRVREAVADAKRLKDAPRGLESGGAPPTVSAQQSPMKFNLQFVKDFVLDTVHPIDMFAYAFTSSDEAKRLARAARYFLIFLVLVSALCYKSIRSG